MRKQDKSHNNVELCKQKQTTIGQKMAIERTEHKYSVSYVVGRLKDQHVKISEKTYRKYEDDESGVTIDVLLGLCKIYKVPLDYFAGFDNSSYSLEELNSIISEMEKVGKNYNNIIYVNGTTHVLPYTTNF